MPLNAPIIAEIGKKTWLICFPDGGTAYALAGEERGLLVDDCISPWTLERIAERLFAGAEYEQVYTDRTEETAHIHELGDRKVLTVPGVGYYDESASVAFTGGNIGKEINPRTTVSDLLVGLMRLHKLRPERIYTSAPGFPGMRSLEKAVLNDAIGACRAALHPTAREYSTEKGVIVYGGVTLRFDPEKAYGENEPRTPYPLGI